MDFPLYGPALEWQQEKETYDVERENIIKSMMAQAQGIDIDTTPGRSFLSKAFDVMQTPLYGMAGAAHGLLTGEGALKGLWEGLSWEKKRTWSDVLKLTGVPDNHARIMGLAMDMVIDPVMWFPAAKFAKGAAMIPGIKQGIRGSKALLDPLAKTKAMQRLARIFNIGPNPVGNEKWLYEQARRQLEDVWGRAGVELAKKSNLEMNWEDIYKGVQEYGTKLGKRRKLDVMFDTEEMNKIRIIAEENQVVNPAMLRKMSYDEELIQGAVRYKRALKSMIAEEQKLGLKVKEVEKYWPGILEQESIFPREGPWKGPRGTKPAAKFTKKRKYATTEERFQAGYLSLPPEQQVLGRALAHAKMITYQRYLKDVLIDKGSQFGIHAHTHKGLATFLGMSIPDLKNMNPGEVIRLVNEKGYKFWKPGNPFKLPHKDFLVPGDIADALQRVEKLYSDNPAVRAFEQGYDYFLNIWRSFATVINPGFHFRNTYSNWFNMYLADVRPWQLPHLLSAATGVRMGKAGKVGRYTYDEIRAMIGKLGVQGKGWTAMQYIRKPEQVLADFFQLEKAVGAGLPVKAGRWLGRTVEDNARIALFIDGLEKGNVPLDAALRVKKYLFDYGELSLAEKKILRRVIPFYTWMRKNAPLQVEHLWAHTRKYGFIPKVKKAMEGTGPEDIKPPYYEELYAMKIPESWSKWLSKSGLPLYFNPNLPFQDLNRVFDPQDWINSAGPWKAFFEVLMNKSFFTKAPLEVEEKGGLVHRPWMFMPGFREFFASEITDREGNRVPAIPGKWAHIIETALPFIKGYGTSAAWAMGGPSSPEVETKGAFKTLAHQAGIKFMPYQRTRERRAKAYRERAAIRAAIARAKQINPLIQSSMVK